MKKYILVALIGILVTVKGKETFGKGLLENCEDHSIRYIVREID